MHLFQACDNADSLAASLAPRLSDERDTDCSAAVLLPLVREHDEWCVLLIRRAEYPGDVHSGQVALPGGRMELEDEDAIACALRETKEELGLASDSHRILGSLSRQKTGIGHLVRPVLAITAWPQPVRPEAAEVAHWFTVPVSWMTDADNRVNHEYHGKSYAAFKRYAGEFIWGMTACVLLDLVERGAPCIGRTMD